jgi:hypothetical protein
MVCEPMCTGFFKLLIQQWPLDNHTAKSHSVREIVKYVWKGIAKGNSVILQILQTISTDQTTKAKGIMSWWQHAETREFSNESWTRNHRYKHVWLLIGLIQHEFITLMAVWREPTCTVFTCLHRSEQWENWLTCCKIIVAFGVTSFGSVDWHWCLGGASSLCLQSWRWR